MIYISIPNNWVFDNTTYNFDALVDGSKETPKIINLQELVKEWLRTKKRHVSLFTFDLQQTHNEVITVYCKRPPDTEDIFIQYFPNQNGKQKSTHALEVKGKDVQGTKPVHVVGSLWHQIPENLSAVSLERLDEVRRRSTEQKYNRQHIGNCPSAT
ncbi:MAG: hypothetical protein QM652_07150 [Legionella sp.]|uniref:hypothetical protein n=1 Tax=Legionella sp. TaxID=459 RepID=UPI0039E3CB0F